MRARPIATASRVDHRVEADGPAIAVGVHVQPVPGLIRPVNPSPTIRRKLHHRDGSVIDGTNLPTDVAVGRTVRQLAASPDSFYLPHPAPALDVNPLILLQRNVYLLGEDHGDGTWETRTAPWPHINKLKEAEKGFTGQDPTEKAGIERAFGPNPRAEALEDMTAYLVAQATLLQNMLGDKNVDVTWWVAESLEQLRGTFRQVHTGLTDHVDVCRGWLDHMMNHGIAAEGDVERRYDEIMALVELSGNKTWLKVMQTFAFQKDVLAKVAELPDLPDLDLSALVGAKIETKPVETTSSEIKPTETEIKPIEIKPIEIKPIATTPKSGDTGRVRTNKVAAQTTLASDPENLPFGMPGPKVRAEIQVFLQKVVAAALAILDTRPTASLFGTSLWRKGDDPIPNRSLIEALSTPGSDRQLDVIPVTSPLRESKMAERILAKPAPLLVKVGNRHLDPLVNRLRKAGRDAIPVPKGVDFDKVLSFTNRPD